MRYKYCLTWNMARKTEKGWKWEMHTLRTGMKTENHGKLETHTLGSEIC